MRTAAGIGYFPFMKKKLAEYGVNLRLPEYPRSRAGAGRERQWPARTPPTRTATPSRSTRRPSSSAGGFGEDAAGAADDLEDIRIIGTPGHYGDGVNMMINSAASSTARLRWLHEHRVGRPWPWDKLCWGGPCLWVDINGERFGRVPRTTHNFELQNACPCAPPAAPAGASWTRDVSTLHAGRRRGMPSCGKIAKADDAYKADTLKSWPT